MGALLLMLALGVVTPEEFCSPEGCPTSTSSWSQVFEDMLTDESCMPDRYGELRPQGINLYRTSCTVRLACRDYRFDTTLEVPRATRFVSECPCGEGYCSTRFLFPCDTAGVWVPGFDSGGAGYLGAIEGDHLGSSSSFEDIQVGPSESCPEIEGSEAHGFRVAGRVFIGRAIVFGMQGAALSIETVGISNPALSRIRGFEGLRNGNRCIDVSGSNSNQILFEAINCKDNCQWATNGGTMSSAACTEVREAGKLGNIYAWVHINNALVPELESTLASARSAAYYWYSEDGVPGTEPTVTNFDFYSGQGMELSGSSWGRWGGREHGLNHWRVDRGNGFDNIRLGGQQNFAPNAVLGVQGADSTRFSLVRETGLYRIKTGLTAVRAIDITSDISNEVRIFRLRFGGGHAVQGGGKTAASLLTVDDCDHPPEPSEWLRGSIAVCTDVASESLGLLMRCDAGGAPAWCPINVGASLP